MSVIVFIDGVIHKINCPYAIMLMPFFVKMCLKFITLKIRHFYRVKNKRKKNPRARVEDRGQKTGYEATKTRYFVKKRKCYAVKQPMPDK